MITCKASLLKPTHHLLRFRFFAAQLKNIKHKPFSFLLRRGSKCSQSTMVVQGTLKDNGDKRYTQGHLGEKTYTLLIKSHEMHNS